MWKKPYDHLEPLRQRVLSAQVSTPPKPWKPVATIGVGGLTEVGFGDKTEYLLIVSSSGRGVFDCLTGERIARDYTESDVSWHQPQQLRAIGIGPLADMSVRLVGIFGGGLPLFGRDGWYVEALPIHWPDVNLLLVDPESWIYRETAKFTKLAVEREVRAFGFSDSGESLIIATGSDVTIFQYAI